MAAKLSTCPPLRNSGPAQAECLCMSKQRATCALALLTAALFLVPGCTRTDLDTALQEAVVLASKAKWDLAIEQTEKCVDVAPKDTTALVLHGICLYEGERQEDALEILQQAVTLAPEEFMPNFFYGWALAGAGKYADAVAPLSRARELRDQHPDALPDVLVLLAKCCLEQNLPKGKTCLQALRRYRSFAESPEVYNSLGLLQVYQGEYENARESFGEALRHDRENAVVLQNLAVLNDVYLGDPVKAQKYYLSSLAARQAAGDSRNQEKIRGRLKRLAKERRRLLSTPEKKDTPAEPPGE